MVFFAIFMFVFLTVALLALFVNRRQLASRFYGKPTMCLWVGLLVVFLTSLFVMPVGYTFFQLLSTASFEYWILAVPLVLGGLAVMGLGFRLIEIGARDKQRKHKEKRG